MLERHSHRQTTVPYDLVNSFTIAAGQNQGIWSDIYVPKNIPSGLYSGLITIKENGSVTCNRLLHETLQLRDDQGQMQTLDLDSVMSGEETLSISGLTCIRKNGQRSVVSGTIGPMRRRDSGLFYGAVLVLQPAEPPGKMPPEPLFGSGEQSHHQPVH